ncbi:hypothetical protein J2W32_003481 [Variovorax boronicumulans]|uniref:NAD(P)-binding domain-containing protein n=1 Tax=Variovorax boronicumulans TaxID=436515 RepID=A0AAW8D5M9_9BURK|nr:hypothetical protein [Variovorax boronicumulans]MDP9894605.1 hypothetical protein [Variovorax boronicumulans]MDQ0054424.1 hypothetical protein [Variovorax boronicumulans]
MPPDSIDPLQALQAANRPAGPATASTIGTLLIAGATGALGQELLRRLAGSHRYAHARVLAREPIRDGLRGVETYLSPDLPIAQWPLTSADTAVIAFDPPRLYHDRERALWVPQPADLPELSRWLRASGVRTLAIVQPHDQGKLPEALKRGLASLDEQAVVANGFDRVILVRSARKPLNAKFANPAERLAAWMLSIVRFMVPSSEQPVRASKVAELVDVSLRIAPPGVHVAAPEMVWEASQGQQMQAVAERWLGRS